MFIATLFIIANERKQPQSPPTDDWINKMWSIHYNGISSAIKRSEVLIHATTGRRLKHMKGKKLSTKDHILDDSICMKYVE